MNGKSKTVHQLRLDAQTQARKERAAWARSVDRVSFDEWVRHTVSLYVWRQF